MRWLLAPFSFQGRLGRVRYALAAGAILAFQYLFSAASMAALGRPVALSVAFWLVPLRALVSLPNAPDGLYAAAVLVTLLSAAMLSALSFRRAADADLWSAGGWCLGWATALLGPAAVLARTAAVERTVHRHLVEQAAVLDRIDPELAALVRSIQVEEDEHLAYAEARHDPVNWSAHAIAGLVSIATEMLIAMATRGDSLRLGQML